MDTALTSSLSRSVYYKTWHEKDKIHCWRRNWHAAKKLKHIKQTNFTMIRAQHKIQGKWRHSA